MHGLGPDQRHGLGTRTRRATAAATAVLAGCGVLAGGLLAGSADASTEDGIFVQPSTAPIYELFRFGVNGTVASPTAQVVDVYVNGTQVGTAPVTGDTSPFSFTGGVTPAAQGQPGSLTCGANTVTVENPPQIQGPRGSGTGPGGSGTGTTGSGTVQQDTPIASATLTAQCPVITLTPAAVTHASEPTQVLVSGTLFAPLGNVTVDVDGTQVTTSTANDSGDVSVPITAGGLGCGPHQVSVSQFINSDFGSRTLTASATLTVTNCTLVRHPKLAISPDVLEPGEVAHVTGSGFAPATTVQLTWRAPGGGPPGSVTVTPNSKGGFTTSIVILLDASPGPRVLVATQTGATATANALIEGEPMEPSSTDQLIFRGG